MSKLLFSSDWHVRYDQPVCRNDDFLEVQKLVLEQIRDIALDNKHFERGGDKLSCELVE